ncbi:hypothetical protein N311_00024, partial [Apaloderma vittatum]
FAFTLPAINHAAPSQRFEWLVLPQGMKNSPTLCQLYVDWALRPIRDKFRFALIYHYMDDILIASQDCFTDDDLQWVQHCLAKNGLVVAPEKIQRSAPWKYLGWVITDATIRPQKIEIQDNIKTLRDAQKLLGDLQWVRKIVGINNTDLQPFLSWL